MDSQHPQLQTLQDIKKMMERSSRFISLSGWSGVSAGICALAGAGAAFYRLLEYQSNVYEVRNPEDLVNDFIRIGAITFIAAFVSSFFFTWIRSRKNGTPMWDRTVQRLAWNTVLPMAIGGFVVLRCIELGYLVLVAPACLIFYGLALVNASKYTLGEIRYLGYGQLMLGVVNLWVSPYGLYFWAAGFGVLHIVYGMVMWWKYERASGN